MLQITDKDLYNFFGFYKILSKSKYRIKERQDNQRVRFQKEIQNVSGVDELSFSSHKKQIPYFHSLCYDFHF